MQHLILYLFVLSLSLQIFCLWASGAIECASSQIAYTITVSQSGNANFTNVKSALNSIPPQNNRWIKIKLDSGTYKEKIEIPGDKGCIVLEGRGRKKTKITFDAHITTMDSVTFSVNSDNFEAKGVTFENSYYHGAKVLKPSPAVAFGSYGDKHAFYSCGFVGYQDTLWDYKGRHYFKSCYIEGAIDFIFGGGQSVYEECSINVIGDGFITAQGRVSTNDPSGYVLRGCDITGSGHADLGRPYQAFARVIYIDSIFSNVVTPQGWSIWDKHGHENDITFAEVDCRGPGANTTKRVPWTKKLDHSKVARYTTQAFIDHDGWIAKQPK